MKKSRPFILTIVLLASAVTPSQADWRSKVESSVLEGVEAGSTVEVLIELGPQADLSAASELATKEAKGSFVYETLSRVARSTQADVLALLQASDTEHRAYWVTNAIWADLDGDTLAVIAARAEVTRVLENRWVRMVEPMSQGAAEQAALGAEPGLVLVGAPDFWAVGITGQGVVMAGADTGYDWDHPALISQYRGWNGASADHNYNWHDAIHSGGGSCGANSPEPCDDSSHGTHTMGTMVGDDGAGNQVGMAPGARWIGCRNMDQGFGSAASYTECMEFFLAPTDLNGNNPRPDLAPDVISNSWLCPPPPTEDCVDPNVLRTAVENLRAAGISFVVAAGNSGSGCETVDWPAAIYEASFTVGAVSSTTDTIASFSSRGPVVVDLSGRRKPDVSAPGVNVRSTVPGGDYGFSSGTSMAAPHVAGLVALLMSDQTCWIGQPDLVEDYIEQTAAPKTTTQNCGDILGTEVPNNTYGWGSIRAVIPPQQCTDIFEDGFNFGTTSAWTFTIDE